MTKFLTPLYLLLAVALLSLVQAISPVSALAAAPSCAMVHSADVYGEALFQEDDRTSRLRCPNFARAVYPEGYYEKYHSRMNPYHETYAFNRLYLPQFINTRISGSRRLNGSFVALDVIKPIPAALDQDHNFLSETRFYPVEIVWRGRKEDPVFPSTLGQGTQGKLFSFMHSNAMNASQLIEGSLGRIYQSFASQGPERKILVPIVKEQDTRDIERTTHFEYGIVNIKASVENASLQVDEVGHMQIITSTGSDQTFHFEEQWGKINRVPGEVWGEAGRFILKHWELLNPESQSKVPREELKTIKYRLIHKAFAWANNDARLDRLFFQVNNRVRGVLQDMGWPLEHAQAKKMVQEVNGEQTQEWLFNLNKYEMLEIEKKMLKNLMTVYFNKIIGNPSAKWIEMSFDQNEIKTLIKLGVVRISEDNPTPLLPDSRRMAETITLHNPDPNAPPVFTVTPDQLRRIDYLTLHFSTEMARTLISDWTEPAH